MMSNNPWVYHKIADGRHVDNSQWVNIASQLSWKQHTCQLYKKLCSSIYVIRKILQGSKLQVAKLLTVLCLSHTTTAANEYVVVRSGSRTSRNNLERILIYVKTEARWWVGLQWSLKRPYSYSIIPLHLEGNPTHQLLRPNQASRPTPAQYTKIK